MDDFTPADAEFAERIHDSFRRLPLMQALGAELRRVEAGRCEIATPCRTGLCAERGSVHPGISAALADTAAGYAATSLLPRDAALVTVEHRLDFQSAAAGDALVVEAKVERAGPSLIVVRAEVMAEQDGRRRTLAVKVATLMVARGPEAPFRSLWYFNESTSPVAA
ncbi:MAG TPA: PaaI family thioesterase [Azospirillum sp.]